MGEKEAPTGQRGKRNDYADTFYIQDTPDNPDIPDFKISPKIDKIKLSSISAGLLKPLSDLLEENGFKKGKVTKPKGKYDRNRKFTNGETEIKVFYNLPGSDFGGLPIFIEINDPTLEIINLLNSFFSQFSISPKISQLEIAFDFITDERTRLKRILEKHLFLRYQRHPSFWIGTTYYSSDCRKSSKGTRSYRKELDNQRVVRLELVLNRRILRKLGFDISWMPIDKIDFGKYFSFKRLQLANLIAYVWKGYKEDIEKVNENDEWDGLLLTRQAESWERMFIPEDPWEEVLMTHIENVKQSKVPNYSRFLKEEKELNQKFENALQGKRFLPISKKK